MLKKIKSILAKIKSMLADIKIVLIYLIFAIVMICGYQFGWFEKSEESENINQSMAETSISIQKDFQTEGAKLSEDESGLTQIVNGYTYSANKPEFYMIDGKGLLKVINVSEVYFKIDNPIDIHCHIALDSSNKEQAIKEINAIDIKAVHELINDYTYHIDNPIFHFVYNDNITELIEISKVYVKIGRKIKVVCYETKGDA